ncbi:MAG: class I tRNA ligase family protein, partial [bacterium]|nr:class I tRNA ligase family protein [bacterium]
LYRGSKPVMWSVVEKTALAEAEVEYRDYTSDTIWVKFPVIDYDRELEEQSTERHFQIWMNLWDSEERAPTDEEVDRYRRLIQLAGASILIWTTTPWTIPGNRAISYSPRIHYSLYEVLEVSSEYCGKPGDRYVIAESLADEVMKAAGVDEYVAVRPVTRQELRTVICAHPLRGQGYEFDVPMLEGEHVTDEAGTGFVHTAPGHGAEDFSAWAEYEDVLKRRGVETRIPFTVDADGFFTEEAPGFTGRRVITGDGEKGDANKAVIEALQGAGTLRVFGRRSLVADPAGQVRRTQQTPMPQRLHLDGAI